MKILRYALGQMQANCYLLIEDKDCLIIDPGDEADFLLEKIQREQLKPLAILATHGHFDHLLAAGEIQRAFVEAHAPSLQLYLHHNDLFLLKRLSQTAKHYLGYNPVCLSPTAVADLAEGSLNIGSFHLKVIFTPGHTPGGCSFYFKEEQAVFTGDTLFKEGVGRFDFSYSNKKDLDNSLKKILALPEETLIYSGHGETTTVLACCS